MMTKRLDPGELLEWFEHIVQTALMAKDESVEIYTFAAVELLERLKLAKRPRRGRKATLGRQVVLEREDVSAARSLKEKLLTEAKAADKPLSAAAANQQAAQTVSNLKRSGLSATEIEYRMIRPGRKSRK